MSSNPYENEPGFENANSEEDKKNQKEYVAKVTYEGWYAAGRCADSDRSNTKHYE